MIIAIDGPAASGKGTIARLLAAHFNLAYLDTGALYRAVALRVLDAGAALTDQEAAARAARAIGPEEIDDPRLRSTEIGAAASQLAALPQVRSALLEFQRNFAENPPADRQGAVLDGRDIGTVICPDADIKLFITADLEERARRRYRELDNADTKISLAKITAELARRDQRDLERKTAPLTPAHDAHLLDTTSLDIDSAFKHAKKLVIQLLGH